MLQSMTGFGKAEAEINNKHINVEIRALNSKYLDVNLKMPSVYKAVDTDIRSHIIKNLTRGRIDISVEITKVENVSNFCINKSQYKKYAIELRALSDIKIAEKELMPVIINLPDVLTPRKEVAESKELSTILTLVEEATAKVNDFRAKEGVALEKDIVKRINTLSSLIKKVEKNDKGRIKQIKEKLTAQLGHLNNDISYDDNRLEQELIYYLEKLDVTEELIRAAQHCNYFLKTLKKESIAGKKLSFITQELGREVNTIGSKANNFEIQKTVVEMKDELEKIKEQLGNVL